MKFYFAFIYALVLAGLNSCDKKTENPLSCNHITLNTPFKARISEQWCVEAADWKITFGPFIEDSRCNVDGFDCVWAGRYVMAATIEKGETVRDTFFAVHNWSDTLYHAPYQIILSKVYPETRLSMEPLDPAAYSFDIIVK